MKKFKRIFKYLGYYKAKLATYGVLTILGTVFGVFSLGMLAPFISLIVSDADNGAGDLIKSKAVGQNVSDMLNELMTDHGKIYTLGAVCVLIIILTLLKNLCIYGSNVMSAPIRSSIVRHLRSDLYQKTLILPIGFFTEQKKGDIISRMTNDVAEVDASVVSTLEGLIKDPLTILGYLIAMIIISPLLSIGLFILLPLTAILIGRVSRLLKRQSKEMSEQLSVALSLIDETLSGMRVVKAFLAEKLLGQKFEKVNDRMFTVRNKMARRRDLASPMTEVLGVIVLAAILFFGGLLAIKYKTLSGGDLLSYIAMFAIIINPAKSLSTAFFNMQRGGAALDRIEQLLNTPLVIEDHGKQALDFKNQIEFKNVSFGYGPDNLILKNINLTIPKGKTVALVGSSGAGKSTLADLVPRFHDVTSGELLIDGVNIKDYSLGSLRSHISIVTQEPILFNDSIAGNIALGKTDATDAEIQEAAKIANAYQFIEKKEGGLQSNVGDRGGKLSGGEKQRLTIARAVVKNPPILILDEATSSLDTESERLVQDAINKMMSNRTSLVIAHRLSTIRNADEIIVLQGGEIRERGNHDLLMAIPDGIYQRLVKIQAVK
ncbi:ABC transporter ATP-binding protein [Arachidicoccus ginsenosidivorans]|jgi:subfamily B ATP-binding cassette protein MsbA|uniref:ABC transporter ATP-binding protein n=1 Tax=Arachidicoccus ginsenosidivorans TaxID=496057 RepID=A0A5B8VJJ2_9BACT|nr:ABC transporter ATP-binding protein [Arachidicoccus ginsenosidivorans]QEC71132.1 ABC transporter ATP-binding protein [Arachidicoccus ginsenosidivorans]